MNMDEKKRVQHWEKIFSDSEEGSSSSIIKTEKRLNEIDVLLSELSSLRNGSRVYEGPTNSVLFTGDATSLKSKLKKEKAFLKKISPSSSALSF